VSDLGDRLGTFTWAAPEVLLGSEPVTTKADIFSFGVLLYQLLTGEPGVRGSIFPLTTPRDCPPEVAALQQRCIAQDPRLRPTAAEVMEVLRACQAVPAPPAAAAPAAAAAAADAVAAAVEAAGKKPAAAGPRAVRVDFGPPRPVLPLADYAQLLMAQGGAPPLAVGLPPACPPAAPREAAESPAASLPGAALLPARSGLGCGLSPAGSLAGCSTQTSLGAALESAKYKEWVGVA
jgi:hypothetical protein